MLEASARRFETNQAGVAQSAGLSGRTGDGDARVALGNLELALSFGEKVTPEVVKAAAQRRLPGYDEKGDAHCDVISAFISRCAVADGGCGVLFSSHD